MSVFRAVITDTSPAAASTVVGSVVTGLDVIAESIRVTAEIEGATGGTLDVYLQWFDGVTWWDFVHFTQLASGGAAVVHNINLTRTFQSADASGTSVGKDTTPALAANAIADGDFGDRIRALYVAGVSTSAGQAQVITITGTIRPLDDKQERLIDLTSPAG